jgi:hypothetical protein
MKKIEISSSPDLTVKTATIKWLIGQLGVKLDIAQYNTIEGIFGAQPLETYPKNLQLIGPFVQL